MHTLRKIAGAALLCGLGFGAPAFADPQALSPNVPVEVEDALALPRGKFQLQLDQRYTQDAGSLVMAEPVFKFGAAKGLQIDVSPSYNFGSSGSANKGLATVDALYNFNHDSKWAPALAVHGYVQFGYGPKASDQYVLRGMATKYLGDGSDSAPRLHANLTWTHVNTPGAGDRDDQYSIGIAYSQLVTKSDSIVVDFVHGNKAARHEDQDLVDAGFIHQFNERWSLAFGAGAGVSGDSPDHRVFFALQRTFDLF